MLGMNQVEKRVTYLRNFSSIFLKFQDYRKQRQVDAVKHGSTNSTSKIDSVARILFPVRPHIIGMVCLTGAG